MPRKGIVAFFDILGYQNIIDNNQIEDMAALLEHTFKVLPKKVAQNVLDLANEDNTKQRISLILNKLERLIVSDSIVLAIPIEIEETNHNQVWLVFTLYVAKLMMVAFEEGLPLRGAIDYGDFYIRDMSFAGKPIINSYRLSNELNFSGCAFTENSATKVWEEINKQNESNKLFWSRFVMQYYVPLASDEKKLFIINWFNPLKTWNKDINDMTQYIYESFHAHNKDIPLRVMPKIENTERTLRFFHLTVEKIEEKLRKLKEKPKAIQAKPTRKRAVQRKV